MTLRLTLAHFFVLVLLFTGTFHEISFSADSLRLKPGIPVVLSASESLPVRRAARDLCRDLEWVLKMPSPLLETLPDKAGAAIVISSIEKDSSLSGQEAHAITVRGNQVLLHGTDMRGAIYAIYSFSEHFLDMPPWWFWANWKPRTADFIEIPNDTQLIWKAPR
jgi:hypothetical protein